MTTWNGRTIPSTTWSGRTLPTRNDYFLQDVSGNYILDVSGRYITVIGTPYTGTSWNSRTIPS